MAERRQSWSGLGKIALLLTLAASTGFGTPSMAAAGSSTAGASFHVDVAHDGNASHSGFVFPVHHAWRRSFRGPVGYPVIGDGKVFVAVYKSQGPVTHRIIALDPATGSTIWHLDVSGGYGVFGLAEDAGRLFTLDSTGLLSALDAGTGSVDWSNQLPGQYLFTSPPTAADGVVYVSGAGSGGTVYAVDETTGEVIWTQSVANGDHSAPTITPYGVVVGYACFRIYDLAPGDGSVSWHHATGCDGGGGRTTAYYADHVYARGDGGTRAIVLHADTGRGAGSFTNGPIPAFTGTMGFFLDNLALRARDLATMGAIWSFKGDGTLNSEPLVIGQHLFVASSSGWLYVLRAKTGTLRNKLFLGAAFQAPDEHNALPLTGINAGEGLLLVPARNKLIAFR